MSPISGAAPATANIGVIGFGKLGLLHTGLFNGLEGSRVSAIADTSAPLLNLLKTKMEDVAVYRSHADMLAAEHLDGVVIATPTNLHIPVALDCVAAGVPVMIEKPLSTTLADARPLLLALREHPLPNLVAYMTRHIDTFRKARDIVHAGALGRLQQFRATMYIGQLFRPGKGWRYSKEASGGGVLITQNSHLIDMLMWMFGEVDWVSGHAQYLYSSDVEDSAHAFFRFENGLTGYLDSSWSARHHRKLIMSIHVQGEKGTLDVDDDGMRVFLDEPHGDLPAGWTTFSKPEVFEPVSLDIGGPQYTRQAETFLAALRGEAAPGSDVVSAARVQAVIEAFYVSAAGDGARTRPEKVA